MHRIFLSITPETIILSCFFSKVFNQSAIRIFYCTFIGELDVSQKHSTDSISTFSGVIYNEWKRVFSKMWQWKLAILLSYTSLLALKIKDYQLWINIFKEFFERSQSRTWYENQFPELRSCFLPHSDCLLLMNTLLHCSLFRSLYRLLVCLLLCFMS